MSEQVYSVKNGTFLYIMGVLVAIFVLVQSAIFLARAWKRGKEIGLSTEKMKAALVSSGTFSIVPSIPIVIALLTLAATLGVPFAWARLTVIGSMIYETTAAGAVADVAALGKEAVGNLNAAQAYNYDLSVFSASMWVMTLGILIGPLFMIFGLKRYQKKIKEMRDKNSVWTEILVAALFMGMIAALGSREVAKAGVHMLTVFTGAMVMLIFGLIIHLTKAKWLESFALPVSIIAALAASVGYATWFAIV
ncbi:MAG: DUF5058 family protein [Eubacteriales bacterium]